MKREKTYNYFYIVNNLLNGRFYLGVHSTDTLADGYMGSGKLIKKAIKSYGKEYFELTPLKFFKTRKELMDFEREIVNERFLTYYKDICYNLKRGGEGGCEKRFSDEELRQHHYETDLNWKKNNPERVKEIQNKYNEANPGKREEATQKWRNNHPEKAKEITSKSHKKQYHKNKEKKLKQSREWAKNNPERYKELQHKNYLKRKAAKLASQSTPGR